MIDLNTITTDKFLNGINTLINKQEIGFYKLLNIKITEKHKEIINTAITLRKLVNEDRGVDSIEQYQRLNPEQIDLKAMIGEYMFSKLLYIISTNEKQNHIEVITPPFAEMILNKKKQDIEIIKYTDYKQQEIIDYKTFDIKSQFKNNKNNNLNINIKSFDRMKKQSKFFIYAEIDGTQNDFTTNNNVNFYFINNDWYEQNSIEVLISTFKKFTPYRSLPLKLFN